MKMERQSWIFKLFLTTMGLKSCLCFEPFVNTRSLPIDVYKNAETILLISTLTEDICCGVKLTFTNNMAELKLSSCTGDVTCEKSPGFRKTPMENECDNGIPIVTM